MLPKIIEKIKQSVVLIEADLQKEGEIGLGTGFVVHPDGYILTCEHVVRGISRGVIQIDKDGKGYEVYNFKILKTNQTIDMAILKIEETILKAVTIEPLMDTRKTGEDIAIIGFPFIAEGKDYQSTTKGIISAIILEPINEGETIEIYQLDAMVHEGNSGGPCFLSENGGVIGIVNGRFDPLKSAMRRGSVEIEIAGRSLSERTNFSYAIPIDYAAKMLKDVGLNILRS